MSIEMIEVEEFNLGTQIKVIGVGGGGGNAVEHMIERSVQGVEFISANTDAQSLQRSAAPEHCSATTSADWRPAPRPTLYWSTWTRGTVHLSPHMTRSRRWSIAPAAAMWTPSSSTASRVCVTAKSWALIGQGCAPMPTSLTRA